MKKNVWLLSLIALLVSCGDMPENEKKELPAPALVGMWTVENAEAYLTTNSPAELLLEKKIVEILKKKGENKTLCFTENMLYRFSTSGQVLEETSSYYISRDTVYFGNPRILNFYMPYLYGKFAADDPTLFIGYLNKKEAIELVANEDDIKFLVSTLESSVDEAQCEIHFRKGAQSEYDNFLNLIP